LAILYGNTFFSGNLAAKVQQEMFELLAKPVTQQIRQLSPLLHLIQTLHLIYQTSSHKSLLPENTIPVDAVGMGLNYSGLKMENTGFTYDA
jgi:hypothetical protein